MYKWDFKLVKEILSFISIEATSKVGPEQIIPICMVLLKERYEGLFYTVLKAKLPPSLYRLPVSKAF